ncbi:MAG TPA: phenylalanine--tRNA ligase subunit alpha, partial [Oscillospiraceae bacterium]|nr:phenylalanine--tRNA ligase subunit alpha [Oscillospiraceae bacterium]
MKEALEQIRLKAREALEAAGDAKTLEDLRVRFLGKKGELTAILKQMGGLSDEERPVIGQLANQIRTEIENEIKSADAHVKEKMLEEKLAAETVDVTLPGTPCPTGKLHPLNKVLEEFERIFIGMGFSVVTGPEVETDYYNFEALNIPKDHPARDTQDTFYFNQNILLRTQTSGMQVRTMEKMRPPIRIISPGRVFRTDTADAT